ncbi:MAG: glucoamylase family protein, partial [Longimicrobiales bacterium]
VPDRWPRESFSSVAAVGFGLGAYPVGVERGWITRAQAAGRTLTTLRFLWTRPQGEASAGVTGYHGLFYHFLDMDTGERFETVELSTIDTALLMAGVLFAQQYFDGSNAEEREIRALADSLYRRVDWAWMVDDPDLMSMGWHPERGYIESDWHGYDESMILLVLALGSPTHAVDETIWPTYMSTARWGEYYGFEHIGFAPLFGHQYSHIWIDFRGIQDSTMRAHGIDWFENSRRATLAQRAYAIDNPMGWRGYGADAWGLSAADGPADTTLVIDGVERRFQTYSARGTSFTETRDDGTLVPTAVGGSIAFAPEVVIRTLRALRTEYGAHLFGEYGFLDSFNPTLTTPGLRLGHGRIVSGVGWFDTDYLGIDQGPILLMAENYRSGLIWEHMKDSPYIVAGLRRAGFTGGWLDDRAGDR